MSIESFFLESDKLNDRFVSHGNLFDNLIERRQSRFITVQWPPAFRTLECSRDCQNTQARISWAKIDDTVNAATAIFGPCPILET
jgi:hypothetical protein